MTQRQRSVTIGGAIAIAGGVLALLLGAGKPALRAVGVPTESRVEQIVGDSFAAHRREQTQQLDSIKRQTDAIRCVIDGDYAQRHGDACKYGVRQ